MWLDVWRGIAVINMCLYHGLWDLVYYFRLPGFDWYSALPGYVWQQSICWSFIFLSGYSYALGKNKFRRGATILFAGALVEAVAGAFGQEIHYGILSFLGLWQLLLTLPEDQLSREMRLRSWCRIGPIGFILCLGLFFLCRNVNQGSLGFESLKLVTLPGALFAKPIKGTVKNSVGAGDSMVAGFTGEFVKSGDPIEALKWGVACGTSTAFSDDLATIEFIKETYNKVEVEKL